ncbi:Ger(x)C family spore germination protein [Bacillus toyonensis]|uniref:Ger(x)C family spore germination protein n=1 Tax=Bacillus toyonensis TaxID=155322 RepID=UPI00059D25F5|nr:Ger(x)C family spore germination protein [Bacillus toyonensis]KXY15131.1 spore gernimation protein GerH [Bacillus cereus]KMP58720.1 spore gernimation protein GerH [Bacillus toyonensis]KXY78245.1 spore gernimation protein GerH [Bacillus cereus]MBG9608815.1 spore gernimation protein GerH [Bacillus toyonensis]MBG9845780.1 spore gernimation protein GerH [Bacillus toyonensis]
MKKITQKQILLFGISLIFMTGCLQKSLIDDVQLIQGIVYDTTKDKIKATIVCPVQQKGHKVQIFENIANTVKQGREKASFESAQPFAIGQLRVVLFTEQLAKKDITVAYDTLLRDSSIGHTIYLGILEGKGYDLFSEKYKNNFNVAIYIKNLLEHNMETGSLPNDNLQLNSYRYYKVGQDTFMPMLKKQKDKISIQGIALFNEETYVGKLEQKEMFVFRGLLEKHRLNSQEFKSHGGYVLINNIRSTPSYRVRIKNGKPSFYIQVKVDARLQEVSKRISLEDKKNFEVITKNIEKQLNTDSKKLLKKLKDLNVDPLGLGSKFKQKYKPFDLNEWKKIYKTVPIRVKYIVNIENSGVVE